MRRQKTVSLMMVGTPPPPPVTAFLFITGVRLPVLAYEH